MQKESPFETKSTGKLVYLESIAEIGGRDKPAMKGISLTLLAAA